MCLFFIVGHVCKSRYSPKDVFHTITNIYAICRYFCLWQPRPQIILSESRIYIVFIARVGERPFIKPDMYDSRACAPASLNKQAICNTCIKKTKVGLRTK